MLSNYPPGVSDHTKGAPWNDDDEMPEKEFEVVCTQTLSKAVPVWTRNYSVCIDEEYEEGVHFCSESYDFSDTNWADEYHGNDYHNPLQLIELFKDFLEEQLKQGNVFKSPAFTRRLIEECSDWEEDDVTYEGN